MSIKISIYEDSIALNESLSYLIMGTASMELCGAFPDCSTILENCAQNKPDVIVMDIDMPGMTGIEATALVKEKYPSINIMMLTVYEQSDKVFDAICAGATGYLLKKSSSSQIIDSIIELHQGGSPMSGEIARKVLGFFSRPALENKGGKYALSSRELDILKCLVHGDSYKMIAQACSIGMGTVRCHINSIYRKLNINSKSEAVIKAMKEGLV